MSEYKRYITLTKCAPDGDRRIAIDPRIIHTVVEGPDTVQIHTSTDGLRFVRNTFENVMEKIDEYDTREDFRP